MYVPQNHLGNENLDLEKYGDTVILSQRRDWQNHNSHHNCGQHDFHGHRQPIYITGEYSNVFTTNDAIQIHSGQEILAMTSLNEGVYPQLEWSEYPAVDLNVTTMGLDAPLGATMNADPQECGLFDFLSF